MIKSVFITVIILTSLTILSSSLLAQTTQEITSFNSPQVFDKGFTKLTKKDMELLLKDANPKMLKQLAENPIARKKYIENLRSCLKTQKGNLTIS